MARAALSAVALLLVAAGCSQGGDEVRVNVGGDGTPPSGTATAGASGPAPEVVDTIATGLEVPWGLAFLPSGDAVVTERDSARVLVISGPDHEVTEVGSVGAAAPQGEGGLLGVAVSPAYDQDHLVFFYVSAPDDNRIVKAELRGDRLGPVSPVLTGIPLGAIHDGGRLAFGPDGMLYASTGETGDGDLAQDRDSLGGKILRMTPGGKPAPGNPFDTEVWSFGHRNVQGLAFVDGQLWASEFGQSTFDELNRIDAGANYGWPVHEGTGGASEGYTDPQATWGTDVASPSGLAYADGALWMAALRGNRLWKIPLTGSGADQTAGEPEPYFVGAYGRMRTVVVAPDGNLWVTTSNRDGRGSPGDDDDQILVVDPTPGDASAG
ncbi:PQQ-dependent sugar dehydrogenase [Nocardioides halotolerans]|uniref:PQQ-dependent sugar dehydrogenase n=1 Tax=Nocardioides halotolerans TaxID=433660 RepID=UPI00040C50E4|nr:PQQ-dependent sugar dehydrogenase [Nocardioides halotolerans]